MGAIIPSLLKACSLATGFSSLPMDQEVQSVFGIMVHVPARCVKTRNGRMAQPSEGASQWLWYDLLVIDVYMHLTCFVLLHLSRYLTFQVVKSPVIGNPTVSPGKPDKVQ